MKRKFIAVAVAATLATGMSVVHAQQGKLSDDVVKIGVLTDMSGVYADYGGPGAVMAAKMAVEDFGGKMFGKEIQVISADHQNKPDIAKNVTLQWFDRHLRRHHRSRPAIIRVHAGHVCQHTDLDHIIG